MHVLSGRDVSAGGTWLALSAKTGRFGILTNFRESPQDVPLRPAQPRPSRGSLVRDWVAADESEGVGDLKEYLQGIARRRMDWTGFNLLVGLLQSPQSSAVPRSAPAPGVETKAILGFVTNRDGDYIQSLGSPNNSGVSIAARSTTQEPLVWHGDTLGQGVARVYDAGLVDEGLSNGCFACREPATLMNSAGAPEPKAEEWQKVVQGKRLFRQAIDRHSHREGYGGSQLEKAAEDELVQSLFDVLR